MARLVCDPAQGITSYRIEGLPGGAVEVPAQADGSLSYDVSKRLRRRRGIYEQSRPFRLRRAEHRGAREFAYRLIRHLLRGNCGNCGNYSSKRL